MKLTIEQALQRGVTAHNSGNLQEAELVYQAILKSHPKHPDANHNLGLIAISVNQIAAALPLFKTALDVNPMIEQFWVSYIDALIRDNQIKNAKRAIVRAKKKGFDAKKLEALLSHSKGATDTKEPSQAQLSSLLECYQNGRLSDAEKLAISLTKIYPSHPFSWKVLGTVLRQTGRTTESLTAMQTSTQLAPQDAEAHNNLGNTLKELGRLSEAEASYTQAIALKPDYSKAHNNLGNTLKELGRLSEAEASYTQAIALKPDYAEAHNNLGATLRELNRLDEAEARYRQAIALKPDLAEAHSNLGVPLKEVGRLEEAYPSYIQAINLKPDFTEAYLNLIVVIKKLSYTSSNPQLYPILTNILTTGNLTRPQGVAGSILSLLKHDPLIKDLLPERNIVLSLKEAASTIAALDKLTLLHHLMRLCPLPDLEFERLFVAMRSFHLTNLDKIEASPKLIYFLSSLCLHCFTNEYVYVESNEETQLVEELEALITQTVAQSEQPEVIKVLCLASYRPLHQYDWCQKLEVLDHLGEVKARLIEEPLAEKKIEQHISVLGKISDDVSLKVREQYEENPYPRWVKLAIPIKAKSIAAVCNDVNLHLHSESIKNVTAPVILIAGCGTGQHSIETASRFSGCQVTAVDLSLASLAYAQRKTNELGVSNLEYLQADILNLHQLGREFDIIESSGVLHHMGEPMAGWKVLTGLLKPGGLMKVGLYSELARGQVIKTREKIASLGIGASAAQIRNFRESLSMSEYKDHEPFISFPDYFSLSEFRDLVFHVQERRFTLLQIQDCLSKLGLKFCGFENDDIASRFKGFHSKGSDICDLALWHQFEESNPDFFVGMYQFWCQKL